MFHCHHMPWGPWWDKIAPALQLQKIEPDKFISSFSYNDPNIGKYRYAHLSDIARLEILIKYGGIYADIDTLFIKELPERLFDHDFVMGHEKVDWKAEAARAAGGSLCNAFMMGAPGSDFARLLLARTYESFNGTWNAHSTFLPYQLSGSTRTGFTWNLNPHFFITIGQRKVSEKYLKSPCLILMKFTAFIYGVTCGGNVIEQALPASTPED